MKEQKPQSIIPVQPYVIINTDDYERLVTQKTGISHFYEFTMQEGYSHPLLAVPDGSVDLLFGMNGRDVKTYIGGTVLSVKRWPLQNGRIYFGVRFEPGRCMLPRELSIREIINDDLELDESTYGHDLTERLAEAGNIYRRASIFMGYYMEHLMRGDVEDTVHNIESYIRGRIYESRGNVAIKDLAGETGYSECYIRRVFEQVHGISPKVFGRIVRFQNVLNSMSYQSEEYGIGEIATDSGYYDQSHMIKDFKQFAGVTPETYQNMMADKKEKWTKER